MLPEFPYKVKSFWNSSLAVSGFLEDRRREQKTVITIIQNIIAGNLDHFYQFEKLLALIEQSDFNEQWCTKKMLGHVQRCVCSGERYFEQFGLWALYNLPTISSTDPNWRAKKILLGQSPDTTIAWTLSPFLLKEGVDVARITRWIGTGEEDGDFVTISLAGLNEFGLSAPFAFPDRFSLLIGNIDPNAPTLDQHQYYPAAQWLAHELIQWGFVE